MTAHPSMDPNAFGILQEIAAQEDSVLLRSPLGPAGWRPLEAFLPRRPLLSSAPFLSSAERHLLDVYREEVAGWLRLAAFQGIFEDPARRGLMTRELDAKRLIELPGRPALRDRAATYLAAIDPTDLGPEAAPALRRGAAKGFDERQDPWELAALSLRLQPHPTPIWWFAFTALKKGQVQTARRALRESDFPLQDARPPRNPTQRAFVDLAGAVAAAEGQWQEARDFYGKSAESPSGAKVSAFCWALNAAQGGDSDTLRVALDRFDEFGEVSAEFMQATQAAAAIAKSVHSWKPTASAQQLGRKLQGPTSQLLQPWLS